MRITVRVWGSDRLEPAPERLGLVVGHLLVLDASTHAQDDHPQQRHHHRNGQEQQRVHERGTCAIGCDCKPQSVPAS